MENSIKNDPVFLDTSAIIALCYLGDAHHSRITGFFKDMEDGKISSPSEWVLSNLVLAELLTLVSRLRIQTTGKITHDALLTSLQHRVVWVDAALHQEGCVVLEKFSTQRLSFTDAVSFAIMRQEKIRHAVTFDTDFAKAGFRMLP